MSDTWTLAVLGVMVSSLAMSRSTPGGGQPQDLHFALGQAKP